MGTMRRGIRSNVNRLTESVQEEEDDQGGVAHMGTMHRDSMSEGRIRDLPPVPLFIAPPKRT